MTAIRKPGKINQDTTMIDIGMYGVAGVTAVYVIRGERTCLIDSGTRTEASTLIKALKRLDVFPPDIIVLTHSHYDHAQGVLSLRREADKQGKTIDVMASHHAIPLLEDQSYNKAFDAGPYENITDVAPLEENDTVELGSTRLRVFEFPGHHKDQIGLLDENHENLFVGDAIGYKIAEGTFLPPFMPPFWDPDAFDSSLNKLKQLDYQMLCIAHFGCIYGEEARTILDEAQATLDTWWRIFEANEDRLDDADYMLDVIIKDVNPTFPDFEIISPKVKALYGLMSGWNRLTRKRTPPIGELLLKNVLGMLATGYRTYHDQQQTDVEHA
jgi:glyoxylase-like metal-dependent hydrolase (beta-lactamase superfamily II)